MDAMLEQMRKIADAMYPGIIEAIDLRSEIEKEKKEEKENAR